MNAIRFQQTRSCTTSYLTQIKHEQSKKSIQLNTLATLDISDQLGNNNRQSNFGTSSAKTICNSMNKSQSAFNLATSKKFVLYY